MILQALYEYYQRKAADPESGIAPEGFEWKEIPFIIVIDREGKFVRLEDTREGEGRVRRGKTYLVPRGEGRAGPGAWQVPNLLWDHYGYILSQSRSDEEKDKELAQKQHGAFKDRLSRFPGTLRRSQGVISVLAFYDLRQEEKVVASEQFKDCLKIAGCNLMFRVEGDEGVVTDDPLVKDYVVASIGPSQDCDGEDGIDEEDIEGVCLVTGLSGAIARKHNRTPINKDTKSLVAIQRNSGYDSYGKEQAYNCPIGKSAEFSYTTALNVLLKSDHNRLQVGDATAVFWAQKTDSHFEKHLKSFFFAAGKQKDDPDKDALDARANLLSVISGIPPDEMETRFYILGLSPNAARISVRFWHQGTIGEFCEKMRLHFDDLDIIAPSYDQCRMSLQYLLGSTVRDWKSEDIPPNLAGNVMRSVLEGTPYPETFANQCLRRIRAERDVTRVRASILKACLNRKLRVSNPKNEKEMAVALDLSNTNVGYRLGRLFAVLEKIQEDASPGLNATIRDRFYGAASSNPVAVFPQLLKLKNHHLSKIENQGFKIGHEKRLAEIIDGLPTSMPGHLIMDDQARFAIGYYHQRQALFTSNKDSNKGE
jgi:CRISPR-associated protein Csd1